MSNQPHRGKTGRKEDILNVRAEITKRRNQRQALIEAIGNVLATPSFFLALFGFHFLWILCNLRIYPWFEPWDPYPFTFLATLASAEAPFISLLILMHQQRNARIEELRGETNLQVSLHVERELSVTLRLLLEIQEKMGLKSRQNPELLDSLQQELDPQALLEKLRRELRESEEQSDATAP